MSNEPPKRDRPSVEAIKEFFKNLDSKSREDVRKLAKDAGLSDSVLALADASRTVCKHFLELSVTLSMSEEMDGVPEKEAIHKVLDRALDDLRDTLLKKTEGKNFNAIVGARMALQETASWVLKYTKRGEN